MTGDLTAWLREQLDADARVAQAAYDEASDYEVAGSDLAELHFLNWKPDRVLADVAAKRRLLDDLAGDDASWGAQAQSERRIRVIAEAYADRPGYQEDWRPTRAGV